MPRPCHVLRVFTRDGEGGNALGVVNDHIGLDTETMQAIATELGFSETTFVDWQPGTVPFVRIFTPAAEMPFAGHPMVGTAWVFQELGPGRVDRLACRVGEVEIRRDERGTWIDAPPIGDVTPSPDLGDLVERAGLPQPVASWLVEMPLDYVVLDVGSSDAVRDAASVLDELDHFGTYLFARDGDAVHARFFAPGHGVPEDPATGSAAVALAAVRRFEGETEGSVVIEQGAEMGHPSEIRMEWKPGHVAIGGGVIRDEVRMLDA